MLINDLSFRPNDHILVAFEDGKLFTELALYPDVIGVYLGDVTRAASIPSFTTLVIPILRSWRIDLIRQSCCSYLSMICLDPSIEPSSTIMSSKSSKLCLVTLSMASEIYLS